MKTAVLIGLVGALVTFSAILAAAGLFMLGVGGMHDWISVIPTIGYKASVVIVAAARALVFPFEIRVKS